jgi:excisionase family DNA binding protein
MGQTLRDWYRYLERQMHVSFPEEQFAASPGPGGRPPNSALLPASGADPPLTPRFDARHEGGRTDGSQRSEAPPTLHGAPGSPGRDSSLTDSYPGQRRRGGRRPMTETREEIIRRLLDPELTLHEAAAVLNLSKATVRRYTDQGRLACLRTGGGQRRFRLSALLVFLDRQATERAAGTERADA